MASSSNKLALITGGSRGIGREIAEKLAKQKYDIVITGTKSDANEVLSVCRCHGVEAHYIQSDISVSADRLKLIQIIRNKFNRLNLLVNNAGVAPKERVDILQAEEDSFNYVIDINLKGTFFLTQLVANYMIEQKRENPESFASIVNITSVSADIASINRGDYCISKAGLSMVTKLFAVRLGDYNINVNEIRPGIIMTDMTNKVKEKYSKLIMDGLCLLKRWGTPADVSNVVSMLACEEMGYSTGQVFIVDGGLSVQRL